MKKTTDQDKICVEFCAAESTLALPCNKCLLEAQSMLDSCLANQCADNGVARSYFSIICENGAKLSSHLPESGWDLVSKNYWAAAAVTLAFSPMFIAGYGLTTAGHTLCHMHYPDEMSQTFITDDL